ncbi:ap-4-a phosphorylase ii [Anaeramoeba flamelloides]|uniref:Ap-4-a phosphorylase ii n=1 Tax=Anaeramoeba flamelloides TaxID=1746091 RepID=A0ABQ8Z3E3_9EUKA|nr:ap-4-a phosphorylase ii [Anaeramoeba flamelloides]
MNGFLQEKIRTSFLRAQHILYSPPKPLSFIKGSKMWYYLAYNRALCEKPSRSDIESQAKPTDPFESPYTPGLFISKLQQDHVLLWNPFNIVPKHLLIATTNRKEHQEELLTPNTLHVSYQSLSLLNSLVFYNSGVYSCSSQPHRHLHLISLPLITPEHTQRLDRKSPQTDVFYRPVVQFHRYVMGHYKDSKDIEKILLPSFKLQGLPFSNACCVLPKKNITPKVLYDAYTSCLKQFTSVLDEKKIIKDGDGSKREIYGPNISYHLFMSKSWMMVVPRSSISYQGIGVYPIGFLGAIFLKDKRQQKIIRKIGPENLLRNLTNI